MSLGDRLGTLEPNAVPTVSRASSIPDSNVCWSGRAAIPTRGKGPVVPSGLAIRRPEVLLGSQLAQTERATAQAIADQRSTLPKAPLRLDRRRSPFTRPKFRRKLPLSLCPSPSHR